MKAIVISSLICLSILISSCFAIYRVTENTKLLIENGYYQVQNVGEVGLHWVK